ncbi:2-hydroxymuconate tautomerase family protein [Roseovarius aestuarii]|nr:2-hydroxymuconate tautomerase family protein [Roseovarius aestuarii]
MPVIRVEMFEGRSIEQKRNMVAEVTAAFIKTCGGTPASVQVVITDFSPENWGVSGELVADRNKGT